MEAREDQSFQIKCPPKVQSLPLCAMRVGTHASPGASLHRVFRSHANCLQPAADLAPGFCVSFTVAWSQTPVLSILASDAAARSLLRTDIAIFFFFA